MAPRTPYTAVADASFSVVNDSISSGSMSLNERSTPSTNTSGEEVLGVEIPRIQISAASFPGSPVRCTATTPARRPANVVVKLAEGVLISSIFMEDCAPILLILRWVP